MAETTVFKTEVLAILECVYILTSVEVTNRNIFIYFDNRAAINALDQKHHRGGLGYVSTQQTMLYASTQQTVLYASTQQTK